MPDMLKVGIVGLPNVGKSTLFNALLKKSPFAKASEGQASGAKVANYPFTTIDPNVGVVEVPDSRLEKLAKVVNTQKIVPAIVQFVDIAGLVKGAAQGEGLGNKFLAHIREVDATLHVVRAFEEDDVVRSGENPKSDIETINTELILADLETIQKLIENETKDTKGTKETKGRLESLEIIKKGLEKGVLGRNVDLTTEEKELLGTLPLITAKPVIYVFNVSERGLKGTVEFKDIFGEFAPSVIISAKIEAELVELGEEEQKEYLKQLGLEQSGLERLIRESYKLLGLITYFTAGEKEVRAWTVQAGTKAPQAAGTIHTDFEKGFIKAEVINWEKLISAGGWQQAREKGSVRLEGKDYVFQDGDVTIFKFNV